MCTRLLRGGLPVRVIGIRVLSVLLLQWGNAVCQCRLRCAYSAVPQQWGKAINRQLVSHMHEILRNVSGR